MSDIDVIQLFLGLEVLPDEILPVYGVVTHIEFQQVGYGFLIAETYSVKPDVFADEFRIFLQDL